MRGCGRSGAKAQFSWTVNVAAEAATYKALSWLKVATAGKNRSTKLTLAQARHGNPRPTDRLPLMRAGDKLTFRDLACGGVTGRRAGAICRRFFPQAHRAGRSIRSRVDSSIVPRKNLCPSEMSGRAARRKSAASTEGTFLGLALFDVVEVFGETRVAGAQPGDSGVAALDEGEEGRVIILFGGRGGGFGGIADFDEGVGAVLAAFGRGTVE